MWDLPRLWIELVSLALQGKFLTHQEVPKKVFSFFFYKRFIYVIFRLWGVFIAACRLCVVVMSWLQ